MIPSSKVARHCTRELTSILDKPLSSSLLEANRFLFLGDTFLPNLAPNGLMSFTAGVLVANPRNFFTCFSLPSTGDLDRLVLPKNSWGMLQEY